MEFRHLEAFLAIVRSGSFWKAAQMLGCAQPTVTMQVKQLEKELGVFLFDRNGKRVVLSEAGRAFAREAADLLEHARAIRTRMRDVADGSAGVLRVGAVEPYSGSSIVPLLHQFLAGRTGIELRFESGSTAALSSLVADRCIDAAITAEPPNGLDLHFERLFSERIFVLLNENSLLASMLTVRFEDLPQERLMLTNPLCAYRVAVENALEEKKKPFFGDKVLHDDLRIVSDVGALIRAVQAGIGIALLPKSFFTPVPEGTVVREVADLNVYLDRGITRRNDGEATSRVLQDFLSLVRSQLKVHVAV